MQYNPRHRQLSWARCILSFSTGIVQSICGLTVCYKSVQSLSAGSNCSGAMHAALQRDNVRQVGRRHLRREALVGDLQTHGVQQHGEVHKVVRLLPHVSRGRVPVHVVVTNACTRPLSPHWKPAEIAGEPYYFCKDYQHASGW